MSTTIVNAAPMTLFRGINDQSTRQLVPVPEDLPTHLPLSFVYAQKGPDGVPQLVSGDSRVQMFGADSFDPTKPWFNHASLMNNNINAQGNSQMIQRIKPNDAGPNASLRYYLDVLTTQVPVYQRNADGSYALDSNGLKIATGATVAGVKAKWVVDWVRPDVGGDDTFGLATQAAGDQVDSITSTQSIRYPIFDLRAPFFGADGNNNGVRIWAPTTSGTSPFDDRLITESNVFPFRVQFVYRADPLSTPTVTETETGEQFVEIAFKQGAIDRNTESQLYMGDVLIQSYQDLDDPVNPPQYGPFGQLAVYDSQIAAVLAIVYPLEFAVSNPDGDFTGVAATDLYRFNLIAGTSSSGIPYESFLLQTSGGNAVRLSETSTVYAQQGSDGTMTDAAFAASVATQMAAWADEDSNLMDSARYPVSIIWDSGFPLATKYALCNFIAVRKDTAVVLATHDVNGVSLTAAQENSLAIALRTRLQLFPESEYYGTPVCRGMIVGRSGRMLNTQYTKRLPLTHELAIKAAIYMGASNGVWKAGSSFSSIPNSEVQFFTDVNVTYTSPKVRNKDWDAGLVWVQSYQRRSLFFPALKTVYTNDTSILNSFFNMMICVELEKVGERSWRQFTGTDNLQNEQIIERVNKFILDGTKGRFDDRVTVKPTTFFTLADVARGYSWTTNIDVFGPNLMTVMTLSVTARRDSDLVADSTGTTTG